MLGIKSRLSSHRLQTRRFSLSQLATGALFAGVLVAAPLAHGQSPITTCDGAGIGSVTLFGDGPPVTILSATPAVTPAPASVRYCLVKVLVPTAINIWVGLPDRTTARPFQRRRNSSLLGPR
jgi:hypothetical protein